MRHPDWLARLRTEVEQASARDFEWGAQDCCKFAGRCVEAMTGTTYELDYHDKASALRFLAREGGIEAAVTTRLGPPKPWTRAMRGDLVLVDTDDGVGSLGVCLGQTSVFVDRGHGVAYLPTRTARACWSIE